MNPRRSTNGSRGESVDRISSPVGADTLAELGVVRFAHLRGLLIIEERQEGEAAALRDFGDRMQERAGEHHGAAGGRLVAARSVFREAHLATLEVVIQVDRY